MSADILTRIEFSCLINLGLPHAVKIFPLTGDRLESSKLGSGGSLAPRNDAGLRDDAAWENPERATSFLGYSNETLFLRARFRRNQS